MECARNAQEFQIKGLSVDEIEKFTKAEIEEEDKERTKNKVRKERRDSRLEEHDERHAPNTDYRGIKLNANSIVGGAEVTLIGVAYSEEGVVNSLTFLIVRKTIETRVVDHTLNDLSGVHNERHEGGSGK